MVQSLDNQIVGLGGRRSSSSIVIRCGLCN